MRFIFVLISAFLVVSCGDDGGGDSDQDEKPAEVATEPTVFVAPDPVKYEVTRINVDTTCYDVLGKCSAGITVEITNGTSILWANQLLVAALGTETFPEKCDETSLSDDSLIQTDFLFGTKYFIRACLFDKKTAAYSTGLTLDYTTEPAE